MPRALLSRNSGRLVFQGLVAIMVAALSTGCAKKLNPEEKARLVATIEQAVVIPDGAADLRCYERQYAIQPGEGPNKGKMFLIGAYTRAGGEFTRDVEPKIVWKDSPDDLPGVADQGCHTLRIRYEVGSAVNTIAATCYPAFDGSPPPPDIAAAQFNEIDRDAGNCQFIDEENGRRTAR